jgi:alpha-tubulin suppressor-like RCC1 family protein
MKIRFLTKILLLGIIFSSVFPVSVNAATSVTFTTTADFTNSAVLGPDLIAGTADDGTNAAASTSSLTTTSNQATLVGTLQDDFAVVSAGAYHTIAIKTNGTLWGWGLNDDGCSYGCGQVGLGQGVLEAFVPTQVGTDTNWQGVSAGETESYAIKTDGTLWSWGWNGSGQLGLGDKVDRNVPTQVGLGTDWSSVSGGDGYSTFAIKTDGTLWSWGWNAYGQLGLGDKVERITPTQVGTDTHWREVSGNYRATLGLKTDGTLWAWGLNDDGCSYGCGQAGLGQGVVEALVPTQIGTDTDWKSIFPSGDSGISAAIKNDGTLWVWGWNDYGGLGLGDTTPRYVPTQLGSGTDWQIISSHNYQTLGTKTDGTLWAWGINDDGCDNGCGQLGLDQEARLPLPALSLMPEILPEAE